MEQAAIQTLLDTGRELSDSHTAALKDGDLVALPKDYSIIDLERYRDGRRRFRGKLSTSSLPDFVNYVKTNSDATVANSTVKPEGFISPDAPTATVFFNLYNDDTGAGHADWLAELALEKTAAFKSLLGIEGKPLTQRQLIDWMEDWQLNLVAYGAEDEQIRLAHAIAAIGKVDIKSMKQSSHVDDDYRAARSSLEEVEAQIGEAMQRFLGFACEPYHGLLQRDLRLRLSILTSHEEPRLVVRILQKEAVEEDIIREFKAKLIGEIGDAANLTIGTFKP